MQYFAESIINVLFSTQCIFAIWWYSLLDYEYEKLILLNHGECIIRENMELVSDCNLTRFDVA